MGEEEGSSLTRWGEGGCEGGAGRPDHGHGVTAPAQALELLVGVRRLSEEGGCCCALLSEKSTNSSFIDKAMEYRAPKTMGGDATIESSLHWIDLVGRVAGDDRHGQLLVLGACARGAEGDGVLRARRHVELLVDGAILAQPHGVRALRHRQDRS